MATEVECCLGQEDAPQSMAVENKDILHRKEKEKGARTIGIQVSQEDRMAASWVERRTVGAEVEEGQVGFEEWCCGDGVNRKPVGVRRPTLH